MLYKPSEAAGRLLEYTLIQLSAVLSVIVIVTLARPAAQNIFPTNTPTPTATDTATDTLTNTPTSTSTNTPIGTPTDTPTNTPTFTPTNTPTLTNTPTNTLVANTWTVNVTTDVGLTTCVANAGAAGSSCELNDAMNKAIPATRSCSA